MSMLKRLLSVYMMLMALVTAVHYMFTTSLFDTDFVFWGYLNWPMAVAVVIAVVAAYRDKRGADAASGSGSGLRDYLDTSLLFYAAVFLFIAFFREWIVIDAAFASEGDDRSSRSGDFIEAENEAAVRHRDLWRAGRTDVAQRQLREPREKGRRERVDGSACAQADEVPACAGGLSPMRRSFPASRRWMLSLCVQKMSGPHTSAYTR